MKRLIAAFAASCLLASGASGQLYWNVDGTSQIREISTTSGLITNTITSSGTSATRGAAPFGEDRLIYSLPFDIHTINADGTSDTLFNGDTAEGLAYNASTRTLYVYLNNVFRAVNVDTMVSTPLSFDSSNGEVDGIAYDPSRNWVWGVARNGAIMRYDVATNTWATLGNVGFQAFSVGLAYDPLNDRLFMKARDRDSIDIINTTTRALSVFRSGYPTEGGGLAYLANPAVGDAINLGNIAAWPSFPITTNGADFDTYLALWSADGTLLGQNNNDIGTDAVISQDLAPGDYVFVIGECCGSAGPNFGFPNQSITGFSPTFIGDPAIRRGFINFNNEPPAFFRFRVTDALSPRAAAPVPRLDLGVIAPPGSITIDIRASTAFDPDFGVYNLETGELFYEEYGAFDTRNFPPGRYMFVVSTGVVSYAPGFVFGGVSQNSGRIIGDIGPESIDIPIILGGHQAIAFEIRDIADLDGIPGVDVFDLIAFLQAFSAALN